MAELSRDLDDRKAALVDQEAGEAVAEVIRPGALEPGSLCRDGVDPTAPVAVIVVHPRPTTGDRKNELRVAWSTAGELPLGEVLS